MQQLLIELEKHLQEKGFKSYRFLQEGYNHEQVDLLLAKNNVAYTLPEEVYELYMWHNGVSGIYFTDELGIELFLCGLFYPLEVACELYNYYREGILSPNYFPLFGNGDTIHFFIDLDPDSTTYGSINKYDYELEYPMKMHPSLNALFCALNECYTTGAFYVQEDGSWEVHLSDYGKIGKKYGKDCEYWDA